MRKVVINRDRSNITYRVTISMDKYLYELSRINTTLSTQEEEILMKEIRKGNDEAFHKLVNANLRFVVTVAKQYQHQGISIEDLIGEGNIGLMIAAKKFDETKGFRFISYAVWWVRQMMMQAISEQGRIVRLPMNKVNEINHINKTIIELEQKLEREPTELEIREHLNLSDLVNFSDYYDNKEKYVLLGTSIKGNDNQTFAGENTYENALINSDDSFKIDKKLDREDLIQDLMAVLEYLPSKEKEVIKFSFNLKSKYKTVEELCYHENFEKENLERIKNKALKRIKDTKRSDILKKYME